MNNGTYYVQQYPLQQPEEPPPEGQEQENPAPENQEGTEHNQNEGAQNIESIHIPDQENNKIVAIPDDHYTFVALIEIMFTDEWRRNCTGAIIHDYVVISAAHCFELKKVERNEATKLQPELTGSFVIIGSKNMFESGYEQYLPIERVLIHPDYRAIQADLALVYTFAGMMSDKPGNIIPLADGNAFTSVHTKISVLNWNQFIKNKVKKTTTTTTTESFSDSCSDSTEDEEGYYYKKMRHLRMTARILLSSEDESSTTKNEHKHSSLNMDEYIIFEGDECKSILAKVKRTIDEYKTICYIRKRPTKVQGHSGAISIHRNHLVAIAASEVTNSTHHVIIGNKISCYCNWIAENLPGGGNELNCCASCCESASDPKLDFFK
ncbi:PREDICTED: uncharacterized protein LOC106122438 [Papilio xuthus]|uniref:Uncharacterized protein LOC106122438 n=1 Tax=Papilio xuthus TaxID=66420 RepID=A0AAJ6ZJN0_PAPXU|nr:PREDICTED: uncharacterized protein LOC106122438 [Papilio xuthus]